MHPVLENTYLLKEIFEHLGEEYNKECYDAALVCRAFQNPAQDVLWHELICIRPLLSLLPTFKLEKRSNTWVIDGDISKSDLETLQRFGRRVRILTCSVGSDVKGAITLHPSVPTILANALTGQPLLPNLQDLHFSQRAGDSFCCTSLLHVLHSTNLRVVQLRSGIDSEDDEVALSYQDFSSFISRLSRASFLRKLQVQGFLPSDIAQEAVKSFQDLSALKITHYSGKFPWSFFSSFSGLQHLCSLYIQELKFDDAPMRSQRKIEFIGLRSLTLACSFETIAKLLRTIQLPALTTFTFILQFHGQSNLPHFPWSDLFQYMSSSFGPKFSELEIRYAVTTYRDRELLGLYTGAPFDYISRHLLSMRLRKIKLCLPIIESVSIEQLEQIFKAWPTLISLHLWTSSQTTAPDFLVFPLIAQHLPQLNDLLLRIDATNITEPLSTPSFHPLEYISLQPINWPATTMAERRLASFLDSVFPSIRSAQLCGGTGLLMLSELGDQIRSLQAARAREHRRMLHIYGSTLKNNSGGDGDDANKMEED
ncbi:hypothetical protein BJ165DRAFT_1405345 [Panaeolus papilionaceus]|nr:hypothetical protein BJ165DRAFT_1405345 [Panaeolus papilionaceus]